MGLKVRESYYGTDQKPVFHKEYHCAGIEYGYDARGNMTYRWYYGKDGGAGTGRILVRLCICSLMTNWII